jgi:hypothetical protein
MMMKEDEENKKREEEERVIVIEEIGMYLGSCLAITLKWTSQDCHHN